MNGIPDGDAAGHLGGGSAGQFFDGVQSRHILNWNFNT